VTRAVEVLPAALRTPLPWKNGGGVTREIAAFPRGADLSHFDWRVSTAEVRSAGPFSAFPQVERILCVLEGELRLSVQDHSLVRLSQDSAPFAFAGDVPAHAEPHGGTAVDLNVMARRGRFVAAVRRIAVAEVAPFTLAAHTTLIFALARLTVSAGDMTFGLSRWDAAALAGPARCTFSAPTAAGEAYLIEISAVRSRR
jgi:uncharacterized protein